MSGKHISEWDGDQKIPGRTNKAIAMCAYNSKLYIFYKGVNNYSLWMNAFDGRDWAGETCIQGKTSHAPSAVVYQGRLYIAYKGWDENSLWINSFDGVRWSGEKCIAGAPNSSPTLAVFNDRLYAAWNQAEYKIWIISFDGDQWTEPTTLIGRTNCAPALSVFAESLYIAYKGWNNDTLWVNQFNGTEWEGEWKVSGRTNQTPSLAAYRGHLFMGYMGWNDDRIWINALAWIRWEGEVNIPGRTADTPTLISFNDKLYMSYRDGDFRIHIDTLDGVGWDGEHRISGSTDLTPAAAIYRGDIWVATTGSDHCIRLIHSSEGDHWNEIQLLGRTNDSPALANWRGNLCVAYKGWNNYSLWLNIYNGDNWIGEQRFDGRTSHAPALTVHEGMLFIAYKGWNNNTLWINHCNRIQDNDYQWSSEKQVAGSSTDVSPALVSFRGKLYLVYKRVGSRRIHLRRGLWNGERIDWEPEISVPGSTSDTPALAVFGDQLFMLFKGSSDHDIYFNVFDRHIGWLGIYDSTLTGGLTDNSPALVCKEGRVYAVYKGWDDDTIWLNSYRILQAWQPMPPAGFNPLNPHDANRHHPKCEGGEPLNHCFETAHLQVFWNECEPGDAISPSDARRVSDFLECAWEVFTNNSLSEDHKFCIDLNSHHLKNHPRKLPVWIKTNDYENIKVNYGNETPRINISSQGGLCGGAEEKWGPEGYDSTGPHELGHVMNKSYSYFFNSGGSGLHFINEGFVEMFRAILDKDYPSHKFYPYIGHMNLRKDSLVNSKYDGRKFWFYLASTYSRLNSGELDITDSDWGYYKWSDIPFGLRETFRNAAGSISPKMKVRQIPGRDVLKAIQSEFSRCHPKGRFPDDDRTRECELNEAPQCSSGSDSGCVPPEDQLYRLMPLAMRKIDQALSSFWPDREIPELPCRAFRKFLENNVLSMGDIPAEAIKDDEGSFMLLSYGSNTHVVDAPSFGEILTVTITPETLPNGEWGVSAYYINGGDLVTAHRWKLGEGEIRISFRQHNRVVIIVAGFNFGFDYADGDLTARSCNYRYNAKRIRFSHRSIIDGE